MSLLAMNNQIQLIREALENSSDLVFKDTTKAHLRADALTALAELEAAMREPVAYLWQHGETGRTRIVMPDMVFTADANWHLVGPLHLGALQAQQPQAEAIKRQANKIAELTADRDGWIEAHARLHREYHDFRKAALQQAEAAHRYVLELPDGDKREVKIYWIERQETAGEITHRLCIAVDAAPHQAEAVQACGHPMSLLLRSAESNEPLYCEACDDKSGRHDAERRETELLDANRHLQEKIASADALKLHAIEELCQLGYTVKDGELFPPDHLHKLMEAAGHPLAAAKKEADHE